MAESLENLRTSVRIETRDPNGITFQDNEVDYAINVAYGMVYTRVAKALQDQFITVVLVDIVANQREYDLPEDHLRTKMIELVQSNATIPLKRYARAATANFVGGSVYNIFNVYPTFDLEGDQFCLEPTPMYSLVEGLRHTYYAKSIPLVDDDDEVHENFNKTEWINYVIIEAARICFSMVEAMGGRISNDFMERLKDTKSVFEDSLLVRTISPRVNRHKRYFR